MVVVLDEEDSLSSARNKQLAEGPGDPGVCQINVRLARLTGISR